MNKRLQTLLDRIPTWPKEVQDEAAMALAEIEERFRILRSLTPEEQAKLTALREEINQAIERGGSYTDEEVAASMEDELDAWEGGQKALSVKAPACGQDGA